MYSMRLQVLKNIQPIKKETPAARLGSPSGPFLIEGIGPDSPRPEYSFTGLYILSRGCGLNFSPDFLHVNDRFFIWL